MFIWHTCLFDNNFAILFQFSTISFRFTSAISFIVQSFNFPRRFVCSAPVPTKHSTRSFHTDQRVSLLPLSLAHQEKSVSAPLKPIKHRENFEQTKLSCLQKFLAFSVVFYRVFTCFLAEFQAAVPVVSN